MAADDVAKKRRSPKRTKQASLRLPSLHESDLARLVAGEHASPHSILGAHPVEQGGESAVVVRALVPNASRAELVLSDGRVLDMEREASGASDLYSVLV